MSEWREYHLGELVEIYDGPHATPSKTEKGPIFLGISNLTGGRLDLSNTEHLSEEDYQKWTRRVTPQANDIVFSYETRLGEAALIPPGLKCCLGRRMGLLRPIRERIDSRFLLYAYLGHDFQETLRAHTIHGSTVDRIPLTDMPEFPISVPCDIQEQRAIAHILGTLDDKIELNRRMNETLEAMARAIFKSWFVDFDPVRAKTKGQDTGLPKEIEDLFPDSFEETEVGEVPAGWRFGTIDDLADVSSGKRPDVRYSNASVEAKIPLWGGNGPMAFVEKPLIDYPILLTGRVGTLGSVFRITKPCWPSDNTLILKTKSMIAFEYLFIHLKRIDFFSLNRGSTQPLLTQTDLKSQPILLPKESLLKIYHEYMENLYKRIDETEEESRILVELRNTLLPKLISGELQVNRIFTGEEYV